MNVYLAESTYSYSAGGKLFLLISPIKECCLKVHKEKLLLQICHSLILIPTSVSFHYTNSVTISNNSVTYFNKYMNKTLTASVNDLADLTVTWQWIFLSDLCACIFPRWLVHVSSRKAWKIITAFLYMHIFQIVPPNLIVSYEYNRLRFPPQTVLLIRHRSLLFNASVFCHFPGPFSSKNYLVY